MRLWFVAGFVLFVAGVAIATFAPVRFVHKVGPFSTTLAFDVTVFYCASREIGRSDPYLVEPVTSCERAADPKLFAEVGSPSPQPGYVLAAFAPFTGLSEERFAFAWMVTIVALAMASTGFLSRLSGFPAVPTFFVSILGPGYANLILGQLSMLVLLGLAGCAYALHVARPRLAVVFAALTLVEPHVALPLFLSLFVLESRTRVWLAAVCVFALALMLAAVGPAIVWEYFARVLPLQALAEARNPDQYSLTLLATLLGASDGVAIRLGSLQYAAFAVAAVFVARGLRDRFGERAFVAAIPAAAAVIGGPYMHYAENLALVPALLLLVCRARGRTQIVAAIAVALVAFPWTSNGSRWDRLTIVVMFAVVTAGLVWKLDVRNRAFLWVGLTAPIAAFGLLTQRIHPVPIASVAPQLSSYLAAVPQSGTLGGISWGVWMREQHNVLTLQEVATKVPTLVAIVLVVGVAVFGARAAPRADSLSARPS